jgi:hypothetical protein
VGAQAFVSLAPLPTQNSYPTTIYLIYNTIELTNPRSPSNQPDSTYSAKIIMLWFVAPFGIAGLLLYFSFRYCIKKFKGLQSNELM